MLDPTGQPFDRQSPRHKLTLTQNQIPPTAKTSYLSLPAGYSQEETIPTIPTMQTIPNVQN
jgi:hypothetical protein